MHLLSYIFAFVVIAVRWPTVSAHNWMNNPRGRTTGLSKQAPCPARSGNAMSFAAVKGKPFGLEFAQGHPGSYTYFALVLASDEDKLNLASESALNDYIKRAPEARKSTSPGGYLSESIFDKTAIEWSGGRGGATVPLAKDNAIYEKRLQPGDDHYFERPADWRCSRDRNFNTAAKCKSLGVEVAQYQYVPSIRANDVRVAYTSDKYPWLRAVLKYRISKKRAQEYDLAQMMFPDSAEPGKYVLMYMWRGYYNCYDVLLVDGKATGGKVPQLVMKDVWTKTDHSQYEQSSNYVFKNHKAWFCDVLPPNGDVTQCLKTCESKSKFCNAINVVPYKNPPAVLFDQVNIPSTSRCAQALKTKAVTDSSLVCYGFIEPDGPEVGTPHTISDDPRDAVFYSTSFVRQRIQFVIGAGQDGDGEGTGSGGGEQWRFADQCLSCQDARKQGTQFSSFAYRWTLQNECRLCE